VVNRGWPNGGRRARGTGRGSRPNLHHLHEGLPGQHDARLLGGRDDGSLLIAVERAWTATIARRSRSASFPVSTDRRSGHLGLYGLWLMWRDRGARRLVIGLGILMLALWVVPQKLGGGSGGIFGLVSHAQGNHSLIAQSTPRSHSERARLQALAARAGAARVRLAPAHRLHRVSGGARAQPPGKLARRRGALSGGGRSRPGGDIRLPLVARYRGRDRGRVCRQPALCRDRRDARLRQRLRRLRLGLRRSHHARCQGLGRIRRRSHARQGTLSNRSLTWLAAAATLLLLVVFALVPDRFTNRMPTISSIRYALRYQARLREEFAALIRREAAQKLMAAAA